MNDDLSSSTTDSSSSNSSSHSDKDVIVNPQVTGSGRTVGFKNMTDTMIHSVEKVNLWKESLVNFIIHDDINGFNEHIAALGVYRNNGIKHNNDEGNNASNSININSQVSHHNQVEIYQQSSPFRLGSFADNFISCFQKLESEEDKHRAVEFFAQKHLNFYPDLIVTLIFYRHSLITYMPDIFKQIAPEEIDLEQYRRDLAQKSDHDSFQPLFHHAYHTIIHYVEQSLLHDKLNAQLIEHDEPESDNDTDNPISDTPARRKIGGKI